MRPSIEDTIKKFQSGEIDKPKFIESMYHHHHHSLFEYAKYLPNTNIKSIEILGNDVIMTSRDRGIRISCQPKDFRIAPIEILNFNDYEKSESRMLENLIDENHTLFDVGANIGWYSLNTAISNRNAKIYAFEPIPKTYEQLTKNLALNACPNIKTFNFGFSDTKGEFPFYYYPEGSGNASSANLTGRDDVEVFQCEVRTLDEFSSTNEVKVDFIKCDVEGAELLVFRGGLNTIKRDKPIIFSEILRKWSAKFNYHPNEIFDLFKKEGYQAFTAKENILLPFSSMNDATIETNFFFLHAEKHQNLILKWGQEI
jgi:FkbM family methyltransferase